MNKLRYLVSEKVKHLRQQITPSNKQSNIVELLTSLFDMGGIVSGGAVLSYINNKPIKDVDFYFNDDQSYINACNIAALNRKLDICWYFDSPYELHDISYVMCTLYKDKIFISKEAQKAFDTGISELYLDNIIYPERTAKRMLKYNSKYGVKFKLPQVLAFSSLYNIEHSIIDKLISISV